MQIPPLAHPPLLNKKERQKKRSMLLHFYVFVGAQKIIAYSEGDELLPHMSNPLPTIFTWLVCGPTYGKEDITAQIFQLIPMVKILEKLHCTLLTTLDICETTCFKQTVIMRQKTIINVSTIINSFQWEVKYFWTQFIQLKGGSSLHFMPTQYCVQILQNVIPLVFFICSVSWR